MGVGARKPMWRAVYHRVFGWVKVHRTPVNDLRWRQITVETHTITIIRPSHSCLVPKVCSIEATGTEPVGRASVAGGGKPASSPAPERSKVNSNGASPCQ